jgi:hypothetical protein
MIEWSIPGPKRHDVRQLVNLATVACGGTIFITVGLIAVGLRTVEE